MTQEEVKPRFKVGDWVANSFLHSPLKIVEVSDTEYKVEDTKESSYTPKIDYLDRNYHLWTIEDAKDGDIIVHNNGWTLIFGRIISRMWYSAYCFISPEGKFFAGWNSLHLDTLISSNPSLATKEQRALFFKNLIENGYLWDVDDEKLIKL